MESVLTTLKDHKLVAIVRGQSTDQLEETVNSLYNGGIRIVEITLNTPGALAGIEIIKNKFPEMLVGAGTVLDAETARMAIMSGASFLLSPTLDVKTIQTSIRYNIPCVPGVFTPTEALTAHEHGASMVKVFPARQLGPSYFSDLRGPLPQISTMAVGGISLENAESFFKGGVHCLGIGSSLVDETLVENNEFEEIYNRAKQFVTIAQSV